MPGGELLLRFPDYVPSPDTFVVVICAWLARAIIGAQTLISAQVPNPVAYLVEGTAAWSGQGWELESGPDVEPDRHSKSAADFGARHALNLAQEAGVEWIDRDGVAQWLGGEDDLSPRCAAARGVRRGASGGRHFCTGRSAARSIAPDRGGPGSPDRPGR